MSTPDGWDRTKITAVTMEVIEEFAGTPITVRQLYYQLVTRGLPNGQRYYKRVVGAMEKARWSGVVAFDAFVDRDRAPVGSTQYEETDVDLKIEDGKRTIEFWMTHYRKNTWENQETFVEVWIEKKALQGVFEGPCRQMGVGLFACKGYPSLTALYEAHERFDGAIMENKEIVILYFGDHDPSGDDIPRSLVVNIERMGTSIRLIRCALTKEQVVEYGLPPAPTKQTDSRAAFWDGLGQVELDALNPKILETMAHDEIKGHFDMDAYRALKAQEKEERRQYRRELQTYVNELAEEDDDDEKGDE
jgi:hypothetical protein